MSRTIVAKLLTLALCSAMSLLVMAQDGGGYNTQAIIDGDVGINAQGVLGINMASGDANLQSNATAIAVGDSNGVAVSQTDVVQVIDAGKFSVPDVAVAQINGDAFSHVTGAIGINQAAGAANAQANSAVVGYAAEVTADAELAQSISGFALPVATTGQIRETSIADTAFDGARGIVQVNQSAGIANTTSNSFTLRVQPGAP